MFIGDYGYYQRHNKKALPASNTGLSDDDIEILADKIYEDLFSGKLDDVIAKKARTR